MATRTKTIEFASSVDTATLAAATNRDKAIALYIPETVVAFRSVTLMCYFRGDNTAATSLGAVTLTLGDSVGFTNLTSKSLGTPNVNSGESETWGYAMDVTSFFTAQWSGTSNTWYARYNGATCPTANHSFKLIITYDYDDAATTHIKTVRIPIESTRSTLSTAFQTIGGATAIPALTGGYLPENGVVVRQAFLELAANEATTVVTDITTQVRVNGGTPYTMWRAEQNLSGNGCWAYACVDITAEDFSAARSLEAVSDVASRMDYLGGWLTVTYEFNAATSTTIFNSLLLGAIDTTGQTGGTASGDTDSWGRNIYIQEAGTITLKESGVFLGSNDLGGYTLNVAVGAQGFTSYTHTASSLQLGQFTTMHRIDGGGQNATPFATLQRGKNYYECRAYSSTANAGWGLNGFLILNYTSGKATAGVGAHSSSRHYLINEPSNDTYVQKSAAVSCPIAEANYWLNGVVTDLWANVDNTTNGAISIQAERGAGEGEGEGWETIGVTQYRTDNENHYVTGRYASRKSWKRWAGDPDTDRMDLETARVFKTDVAVLTTSWLGLWVTYHAITHTVSGTLSSYTGDGSGITVDIFRADTREWVGTTTTTTGGNYSFTWLEDTEELYAVARQDSTHMGRSDNALAQ